MKKSLYIICFLFVFVSCSVNNAAQNQGSQAPGNQSISPNGENPFSKIASKYMQNENFLQCSEQSIDQCILGSVDQELTLDICNDLLLESNRESCKQNIVISQALRTGDASLCNDLEDSTLCEYEILVSKGISEKVLDVCDDVSEDLKVQCNNTIVQSLSYETLDTQWCDRYVLEIEGGNLESIKQNCISDIELSKTIQAEQEEENRRIAAEQEELEKQRLDLEQEQVLESEDASAVDEPTTSENSAE